MSAHRIGIRVSIFLIVTSTQSVFADVNSWQMANLFQPSPAQLERERKGGVMIYHGLKDTDVHRAIDEQFERLESMMFTGTIVTDDEGQPLRDPETNLVVVEDDGC
jgi:hypothetical protein